MMTAWRVSLASELFLVIRTQIDGQGTSL